MCATVDVHRGQEKPAEMGSVLPQWGPRMELSRGGTCLYPPSLLTGPVCFLVYCNNVLNKLSSGQVGVWKSRHRALESVVIQANL